jgi:cytochrome c biogenesis factor
MLIFVSLALFIFIISFVGMIFAFIQRKNKKSVIRYALFSVVLACITAGLMFYLAPVFKPVM